MQHSYLVRNSRCLNWLLINYVSSINTCTITYRSTMFNPYFLSFKQYLSWKCFNWKLMYCYTVKIQRAQCNASCLGYHSLSYNIQFYSILFLMYVWQQRVHYIPYAMNVEVRFPFILNWIAFIFVRRILILNLKGMLIIILQF